MIEALRDFVEKANSLRISYMVTGSFAMAAYGEIRMTRDIDVVIDLQENLSQAFANLFPTDAFYVSEAAIRRAIAAGSMFNIVSHEWGGKIDCILRKDSPFGRVSFDRRRRARVADVDFWTATKEDLIISKLAWASESHSEMQIRDIANLTSSTYDSDYVADWIEKLSLADIWNEVAEWKTRRKESEN